MATYEIQTDELPSGRLVDKLIEFIESKLQKVTIEKDGSVILITGEEDILSKRKLRFLTRKFLYTEGLRSSTKVVSAGGPAYRILQRRIEIEEEEEEEEELELLEEEEELELLEEEEELELLEEEEE
ncbi:MAG: 60S ribosomal protein L22 [Candidatus Hodarchaeota archaeon]